MKKLLVGISLLLTFATLSSFATCEREVKAKKVIKALRDIDISERFRGKLNDAEQGIKQEGFCSGIGAFLGAVGFCMDVQLEVLKSMMIHNNDMRIVEKFDTPDIENALLDYGDLFVSRTEDSSTFNCELKYSVFTSLGN
jgi:hypothetical protein